jgi:hypothetical protein
LALRYAATWSVLKICGCGWVRWAAELRVTDNLEDLGVDNGVILKCILKKCTGRLDQIDLAKDRGKWRALVNAVMNLLIP